MAEEIHTQYRLRPFIFNRSLMLQLVGATSEGILSQIEFNL